MKGFIRISRRLLIGLGVLFLPFLAKGEEPYSEVYVQGHRCLVIGPADLPPDAPVVLILHGFGTNGYEPYYYFQDLQLPPCRIVLPDGPLQIARFPSSDHAWYNRFTHSRKDMENSRDYLFAVMEHFSKEPSDPSEPGETRKPRPVVIMGFSQGAVMALEAGLNYKGDVEAIVSMSGFIEYPEKTLAHPLASRRTPILLVRGTLDPVIQEDDTQQTIGALRRAGYHPMLKEFVMGHKITYATKMAVSTFLQEVLPENH